MNDNVKSLNQEKTYPKSGELMARLSDLIDEYAGDLSLVSVIGILELKKQCLITCGQEEDK